MTTALRVIALFIALLTVAVWFFGGLNLGRTRTSVPVPHPGPNDQPQIVHENRFLPGVDFLAAGLGIGALLVGLSSLTKARRHRSREHAID